MNAVIARYQTRYLANGKAIKGVGVVGYKGIDSVPTNIATVGCRGRIGGVLLGSFGEVKRSRVDLIEHFLSLFGVTRSEQDMRRLLSTVKHGVIRVQHI